MCRTYWNVSPELISVWMTSSLWQVGEVLVPWKCMLTEESVMVLSPQTSLLFDTRIERPPGVPGTCWSG